MEEKGFGHRWEYAKYVCNLPLYRWMMPRPSSIRKLWSRTSSSSNWKVMHEEKWLQEISFDTSPTRIFHVYMWVFLKAETCTRRGGSCNFSFLKNSLVQIISKLNSKLIPNWTRNPMISYTSRKTCWVYNLRGCLYKFKERILCNIIPHQVVRNKTIMVIFQTYGVKNFL